jgi:hypothetical protein
MSVGVTPHDPAPDETPDLVEGGLLRLRVVAAILVLEAVGLALFAGYLALNLVLGTEETTATTNTVIETVAFVVFAVVLALLGRGALHARRWARAPIVVTQLLTLLGPGVNIVQGDLWYRFVLGVPLCLGAVVALVLTLTPSVTAAMEASEA